MRGPMMIRALLMPLIAGLIAAWGARREQNAQTPEERREIADATRRARQGLRLTRRFGRF
jgi:hypothetical protein